MIGVSGLPCSSCPTPLVEDFADPSITGWVNSYGAFQSYYTVSLAQDPSTISWIGSVQNFLTFFIGAFSGRLLDAGYFIPCFLVGAITQVLGIFFMSLSTKYWQLMLSQGIMTGIGGASSQMLPGVLYL